MTDTPAALSPAAARPKKALVALSGGVDSGVCVRLLQQQGYDVQALVISFSPAHAAAVSAAQKAAEELGVPLAVAHCEALFEKEVVEPFCLAYAGGQTPNPCVVCNPLVKFRVLAEEADRRGIHYIATGHYARVEKENNIYYVARARSTARDQSYMLYRLSQRILSRLLLPVGEHEKPAIRQMAEEQGLSCADKPDSQEICFIPDGDYAAFISGRGIPSLQGNFIAQNGESLGPHQGVLHYTVGQRRGLGLALGQPVFVKEILQSGDVQLGFAGEEFSAGVRLTGFVFAENAPPDEKTEYHVKIRSAAQPAPCRLHRQANGEYALLFSAPLRAPAPGQSAVLYCGEKVMGGGFINSVFADAAVLDD